MGGPNNSLRVIAVVTDALAPFHRDVLDAIEPQFSSAGYGTLAVAGRDVRIDRLLQAANDEDGHAFGAQLDVRGAILVSGATPPTMSDEGVALYARGLTDGPVVSLGVRLRSLPSVEIGWATGIDALMHHVIGLGRRRLVFLRGFVNDPHSVMREAGFLAAQDAAGMQRDDRLMLEGNYSTADARNAVLELLDTGVEFDGVVAANDDMAAGAIAALRSRGLTVPTDVAVVGFDNAVSSVESNPRITTVQLDTAALAKASAELLLGAIDRGDPIGRDTTVTIPSELIVRESTTPQFGSGDETPLTQRIIHRCEVGWLGDSSVVEAVAEAAAATLRFGTPGLAELFDSLATSALTDDRSLLKWLRHVWTELHALLARPALDWSGVALLQAELKTIDASLQPIESMHRIDAVTRREFQERLVMRIAASPDLDTLWDTLRRGLRAFGMQNAWVVTHAKSGANEPASSMELIFSLDDQSPAPAEAFDSTRILPYPLCGALEHGMHVLVPLRAGNSTIGYLVVEPQGGGLLDVEAIALGVAQVVRHVRQVSDLESQAERLHAANDLLDRLAREDQLTGLPNRSRFLECLEARISEATPDLGLSVVFLDLDGFKPINDTFGHAAGDAVLKVVADRLRQNLRSVDVVARLGGDEFTAMVPTGDDPEHDTGTAQRLLAELRRPIDVDGHEVSVSASVGIARLTESKESAAQLMRRADLAMYTAKRSGKNQVVVYSAESARELIAQRDASLAQLNE